MAMHQYSSSPEQNHRTSYLGRRTLALGVQSSPRKLESSSLKIQTINVELCTVQSSSLKVLEVLTKDFDTGKVLCKISSGIPYVCTMNPRNRQTGKTNSYICAPPHTADREKSVQGYTKLHPHPHLPKVSKVREGKGR